VVTPFDRSDMLAGFSQNFSTLPQSAQQSVVADLVQRVQQVRRQQQQHSTESPTAATWSAALQLSSLSLIDSSSADASHTEEEAQQQEAQQQEAQQHQQPGRQQELEALRDLCALGGVSDAFLMHVLLVKGNGRLQVRHAAVLLHAACASTSAELS
jgi:hypothetical protein